MNAFTILLVPLYEHSVTGDLCQGTSPSCAEAAGAKPSAPAATTAAAFTACLRPASLGPVALTSGRDEAAVSSPTGAGGLTLSGGRPAKRVAGEDS